jgi:Tfp pilus assembly protein PilN
VRPVNLIPEERRGASRASTAVPPSYVVIGILAVALIAVTALVMSVKSVDDKREQVAQLEQREAEVQATAQSLAPFANFAAIKEGREQTVASLARSRFDWERVMRELARVLPESVWLVSMTGTAGPEVTIEGGLSSPVRADIAGPALELEGCARSQRDLARLAASLEDIDGVTRVLVSKGERSLEPTATAEGEATTECRTLPTIPRFSAIVAFDAAPVPPGAGVAPPVTPVEPETTTTTTPAATDEGGTGEVQAQAAASEQETARAEERARNAAEVIPSG